MKVGIIQQTCTANIESNRQKLAGNIRTAAQGESEAMDALSDYIYDNDLEAKADSYAFDNAQIEEVIATLTELKEKAKNSVIAAGADVTNLLVNGRFDSTGGWTATLNDFSIDTGKQILERWWCDWKAE